MDDQDLEQRLQEFQRGDAVEVTIMYKDNCLVKPLTNGARAISKFYYYDGRSNHVNRHGDVAVVLASAKDTLTGELLPLYLVLPAENLVDIKKR